MHCIVWRLLISAVENIRNCKQKVHGWPICLIHKRDHYLCDAIALDFCSLAFKRRTLHFHIISSTISICIINFMLIQLTCLARVEHFSQAVLNQISKLMPNRNTKTLTNWTINKPWRCRQINACHTVYQIDILSLLHRCRNGVFLLILREAKNACKR